MNKLERKLVNLSKYKKVVAILTLILFFLSGYLNPKEVYAETEYAWPLPGYGKNCITSKFKMRFHPVHKRWQPHTGIDIAAPGGTPVVASKAGKVFSAGYAGSYGNLVILQHEDGSGTAYAHLSRFAVSKGQTVKQKQIIAYVGNTGTVAGRNGGYHLHFEIRPKGPKATAVDPLPFLTGETSFEPGPASPGGGGGSGGNDNSDYDPEKYQSGYSNNSLNIITNNKFYYQGAPKGHYQVKISFLQKLINFIATIGRYLLTLLVNILFKLPFLGYAALFEKMITDTFNALAGEDEYISRGTNTDLYIDPRRAVNVENIIFGRVELLNVDFFIDPAKAQKRMEGHTGSGQDIEEINRRARITGDAGTATEYTATPLNYDESPIGMLRTNYAKIYYSIFSISVILMLFAILGIAIRVLISVAAEDKAKYKELLGDWFTAFAVMLGSVMFIFFIIKLNQYFIDMFIDFAKAYLKDGILEDTSSIYETVRTRAYDNKFSIGFPSTFIYLMLIWDTIKFSLTYIRRLINVLILALFGPFTNAFQILSNVIRNKPGDKSKIQSWAQDISGLVFMQTIHAAVYTFIMILIFKVTDQITFLNFILLIGLHSLLYQLPDAIKALLKMSSSSSAVSDVLEKNQLDKASKTMKTLIGGKYAKEVFNNSLNDTKNLFSTAGKQIKGVAGAVGKGTVNTALFIDDYRHGRNRKLEEEGFEENTVEVRADAIEEVSEKINELGIDEDASKYLNLLSSSELEKLIDDPEKLKEFALKLEEKNLKDILSADPKFTDPITYSEKQQAQKELAKENRKNSIKEAIRNNKPFYLDENGTYRMLPPVKEFNMKTGKMEEVNPGSKEYFGKLKEAFGLEGEKFKEAGKVSLDTLKVGLSVLGAALIVPGLLGDPANAKTLFNSWAGTKIFSPMKSGKKKSYFKDFKEDVDKYLLTSNDHKVKKSVERTRKRVEQGMPIDYEDAKKIIDNAKYEIKEYQYDKLLEVYPDLESKVFRRASKNIQNKNYKYDFKKSKGRLPYDLKVRREENNLLEELESLAVLEYQKEIVSLSNYAKTYFEINKGGIDHKNFNEEFDTKNIEQKIEDTKNLKEIYLNAVSINKKADHELLEAEIFELDDKEISKIKLQKESDLEKLTKNLTEEQKEDIFRLSSKELEKKAKEEEKKLEQASTKVILNEFKDKNIDALIKSAQENKVDEIIGNKLNIEDGNETEQIVAKSLITISNIYNETVDTETLKVLGKKHFDEAKSIEIKLSEKIKEDKIKEISEKNISQKEKDKQIKEVLNGKDQKELYNSKNITKLTKEEQEKLKNLQSIKLEKMKTLNQMNIEEVVEIWQENSIKIADAVKIQNEKWSNALDEKLQILNALKREDNINNAYKQGRRKQDKVELKVERKTKGKESNPEDKLKDILGQYYL